MFNACHSLILDCSVDHVTDEFKAVITPENINTFFEPGGVFTPLKSACAYYRIAAVKWLLEKGADPNIACSEGYTAMHSLCIHNHKDTEVCLRLLLDAGAHVNFQTKNRATPLDMKDLRKPNTAILLMLHAGARLNNVVFDMTHWIMIAIATREQCRKVALLFAGLSRRRRHVLPKDICVLLGQFIWSMRSDWMNDSLERRVKHAKNDAE